MNRWDWAATIFGAIGLVVLVLWVMSRCIVHLRGKK